MATGFRTGGMLTMLYNYSLLTTKYFITRHGACQGAPAKPDMMFSLELGV